MSSLPDGGQLGGPAAGVNAGVVHSWAVGLALGSFWVML